MTHQPKTLALLISLIGAGMAPSVHARTDLRVVRLAPPALSTESETPAPPSLDLTRWSPGLVWRPDGGAPELNAVLHVSLDAIRAYDEWAPGDMSGERTGPRPLSDVPTEEEPATAPVQAGSTERVPGETRVGDSQRRPAATAEIRRSARESKPRTEARQNRPLTRTAGPKRNTTAALSTEASVRRPLAERADTAHTIASRATGKALSGVAKSGQQRAAVQFKAGSPLPSPKDANPPSHTDGLMRILADILREDVTSLSRDRLLSTVATRFPAAFDAPLRPAANAPRALLRRDAAEQRIERREIVVASQSNRVLRSLETIATSKRQKTTAPVPDEVVVATQAEKVLATLLDLSVVRDAQAKRDARELRKQRDVRRTKVATSRAHAAAQSPRLEPTPIATATNAATQVDIDPTLLRIADPVASAVEVLRADDASQRSPAQETTAIAPVPDEVAVLMRAETVLASLPSIARDVQTKRDARDLRKQRDTRKTKVATLRPDAASPSPVRESTPPLAAATRAATQPDIDLSLTHAAEPVTFAVDPLRADAGRQSPVQETTAIALVPDEIAVLMRAEKVLATLPSLARDVQMKRDPRKQRDTRNTGVATLRPDAAAQPQVPELTPLATVTHAAAEVDVGPASPRIADPVASTVEAVRADASRLSSIQESAASTSVANETVAATRAEKVLATLLELSIARDAQSKLDARDLRKLRGTRRPKVATLRPEAAAPSPVMLKSTPLAATTQAAPQLDIDLTVALVAKPVALAVEALRNDSTQPSSAQQATAIAPVSDDRVVATKAEKVLATLLELSVAHEAQVKRDDWRKQSDVGRPPLATLRPDAAAPSPMLELSSLASGKHALAQVDIDLTSIPVPDTVAPIVSTLHPDAAMPSPVLERAPLATTTQAALPLDIDLTLPPIAALIASQTEPTAARRSNKLRPSPFGSRELAVNESSLDRVRGGFVTDNLSISFGIDRAVYVNGALITSTSLNVSDLGHLSAGGRAAAIDSATLALIQSGAGNAVSVGSISPASIGTVVQNTLNGQQIQNVTVINATANSLGVLRGFDLQSSLRGAVIDSLRR